MDKKISSLVVFLFLSTLAFGARGRADLAVSSIPESLTKDAYAVARNHSVTFEYSSPLKGVEKDVRECTILDEKGLSNAHFTVYGDKFRKLRKFSAIMYDRNGNEMKRYKLSDVKSTQWSSDLASDNLIYYFECQAPMFPFTISYEYEIEWDKGILSFPTFAPQSDPDLSVQSASYTLKLPIGTNILFEGNAWIPAPEKKTEKDLEVYQWKLNDLKPIADEPLSPQIGELAPVLYSMPTTFTYDGYNGSFATLASIGEFQNKLNDTQNTLTEDVRQRIISLTQNANSDKEKVKILYDYLGQNTRYESIQLGIGGFQPATSGEVCKMGFGDCKGLTFYLKSMLNAIGIRSDYTIIQSDKDEKKLQKNFTSYLRTNHVILRVPLAKDTLWLECTNTQVPFGYVHEDISGHDAVAMTPGGAEFVQLPDYPDSGNLSKNEVVINLNPDDKTLIKVKASNQLKEYESLSGFTTLKNNDQIDYVRKNLNLQNASVNQLTIDEVKSERPVITLAYDVTSLYGSKTRNRYFIPLNVFRGSKNSLSKSKRKYDVEIGNGWQQQDHIEINIPDGYEIESLPSTIRFDSPFGSIESEVKILGKNKVTVDQRFLVKSGRWDVKTYDAFYDFMNKAASMYKGGMALNKI